MYHRDKLDLMSLIVFYFLDNTPKRNKDHKYFSFNFSDDDNEEAAKSAIQLLLDDAVTSTPTSTESHVTFSLAVPPLDISTIGELPAIIVDASIHALESSAVIEGGSELVDLSAINTVDIDLGSVLDVPSSSSAAASSGTTVAISDVPHLETSSAP